MSGLAMAGEAAGQGAKPFGVFFYAQMRLVSRAMTEAGERL